MAYTDKYGVSFFDDRKTLIVCPGEFQGEYIIPDSVTSIGDLAFYGTGLTSITIPDSVTWIGWNAFACCTGLTSIAIPDSVTSIGIGAFVGCTGLTSITIPAGVTSIGEHAFSGCTGLTSITIPDSVTSIGNFAFYGCTGLKSIAIPNSLTSIGEHAFYGCTGLTSITIPDSVTSIGDWAFDGCTGLTSITIPAGVTSIGGLAFLGCTGLTSITIPDSVKSIGESAFSGCTGLTSITIPNSVTSIENGAFSGCTGLTSIVVESGNSVYDSRNNCNAIIKTADNTLKAGCKTTIIPDSVKSIGESAFSGCTGLTSITIPDSVTSIGQYAFSGCTGLTSITIPDSVTSIGWNAFYGCKNLSEIIVPLGQEKRFCDMVGYEIADIIRKTAEKIEIRRRQKEEYIQQCLMEQQKQAMMQGSTLFFDTETTGTPRNYNAPVSDSSNWPRLVQLAWIMADDKGNILKRKSVIIKPDGFVIPNNVSAIHGITTERAKQEGLPLKEVLEEFYSDISIAKQVVGHNIDFDLHIVGAELYRLGMDYNLLMDKPSICTMKSSTDFCTIPNTHSYFGGYKWPSLQELYRKLFGRDFSGAHDALADITATKECFFELSRRGIIS